MPLERYAVVAQEQYTILEPNLEPLENRLYGLLVDALEFGGTTLAPHALVALETLEGKGLVSLENSVITLLVSK